MPPPFLPAGAATMSAGPTGAPPSMQSGMAPPGMMNASPPPPGAAASQQAAGGGAGSPSGGAGGTGQKLINGLNPERARMLGLI